MDISPACTAPVQPAISAKEREHPLFPIYSLYHASMSNQLVEASAFCDWLYQYERDAVNEEAARHPRYSEFLNWMQKNKGGARACPAGIFPHNFLYFLEGGRW